jgi:hypothetical protein
MGSMAIDAVCGDSKNGGWDRDFVLSNRRWCMGLISIAGIVLIELAAPFRRSDGLEALKSVHKLHVSWVMGQEISGVIDVLKRSPMWLNCQVDYHFGSEFTIASDW